MNGHGIPYYWDRPPVALLGVTVGFDRMMVLPIALVAIAAFWAVLNHTALGRATRRRRMKSGRS